MKSSNKSKMGDFERKWSEAFEGAEATPSDELWTGIHAKLANAEAVTYKKRMVYYRWAAAVALLLLIGLSTYTFVKTDQNEIANQNIVDRGPNPESSPVSADNTGSQDDKLQATEDSQMADQRSSIDDQNAGNIDADGQSNADQNIANHQPIDQKIVMEEGDDLSSDNTDSTTDRPLASSGQSDDEISTEHNSKTVGPEVFEEVQDQKALAQAQTAQAPSEVGEQAGATNAGATNNDNSAVPLQNDQKPLAAVKSIVKPQEDLAESEAKIASAAESTWIALARSSAEVDAVAVKPQLEHIYLVPVVNVYQPIQKQQAPKLWAGLSFAPGSFDPNYRQQAAETQLVAAAAPNAQSSFIVKEDSNPGLSVAMGMDVGMNLGRRWKVTSGLQYFNSSVDANTNAVAEASNTPVYNSFSSYDLSAAGRGINSGRYIFAPDTDLQSTFEFLSVPVEAGYVVIDRKVQVVLNAGVGTNIFIKNNIQDKQNNLADVTITPGAGAPFKTVYFNGLMGAEVLYGIGDQFNISLKPQYRTALNDFTKSNSEFSSRPSAFGVSLGVQYNIK
ncbi:MAG: hypothetical protein ACR2MX_00635 [Cyclobacteriaceae bacterium]